MRSYRLFATLALATCGGGAGIAACSTDESSTVGLVDAGADAPEPDPAPAPIPPDGAIDAGTDVFVPPLAVGDPCRGTALPIDEHFVAKELCARAVASTGVVLRQLTFAPNADLIGVAWNGSVVLLRDDDGNGVYDANEIHPYAAIEGPASNAHIDVANGWVYAGTADSVVRWRYDATSTTASPPVKVISDAPAGGHPLHTVHVYDGWLYVTSGSDADSSDPASPEYDTNRSVLKRFAVASLDDGPVPWTSGEVVTIGLRNMVGFTRNAAGRMFGVVNGMDLVYRNTYDVHEDNPGEQVLELGSGRKYGFPFCWTAQRLVGDAGVIAPGTQIYYDVLGPIHDDAWCAANASPPATFVQAHSAPLDILFFDRQPRGVLPERWRGGAFVALHGSHARSVSTGFKIVWIPFDASGNPPMPTSTVDTTSFPYETVLGGGTSAGEQDGAWAWGASGISEAPRFTGLAIHPIDGALYIASDASGILYRVGLAP